MKRKTPHLERCPKLRTVSGKTGARGFHGAPALATWLLTMSSAIASPPTPTSSMSQPTQRAHLPRASWPTGEHAAPTSARAREPDGLEGAAAELPVANTPINDAQATREQVLDAIDVRLTPEVLRLAGFEEHHVLTTLADPSSSRYRRARAIAALTLFRTPLGRSVIAALAAQDADPEIRIQATLALARAYGPADPHSVRTTLTAIMRDASPTHAEIIAAELRTLERRGDDRALDPVAAPPTTPDPLLSGPTTD